MPKTTTSQQLPAQERVRTTVYRVVPHLGPDGKPVPNRWDTEEVVVAGVVEAKLVHERAQPLPVARERHQILVQKWVNREAPETWK